MAHNISQRKKRRMVLELQLTELPGGTLAVVCWGGHRSEISLAAHQDQSAPLSNLLPHLLCGFCQGRLKEVRLVRPVLVHLVGPGAYG